MSDVTTNRATVSLASDPKHQQWAAATATRMVLARRIPYLLPDAVGAAMLGLVTAAAAFDESRLPATSFRTFAGKRVAGEVLDLLRGEEKAGYRRQAKHRGVQPKVSSLDAMEPGIADGIAVDQVAEAERRGRENLLRLEALVSLLPNRRERNVLVAFYGHGTNCTEIGKKLGLSYSRVREIRREAEAKIAERLREIDGLFNGR